MSDDKPEKTITRKKTKMPTKKDGALMKVDGKSWDKDAVMDYVCAVTATTSWGLGKILESAPFPMPDRRTVVSWLSNDSEIDLKYTRAREERADFMLDEINQIADEAGTALMVDGVPVMDDTGKPIKIVDAASVAHAKLQIETRKWTMGRLAPKKYGEKPTTENNINFNAGENAMNVQVSFVKPDNKGQGRVIEHE